MNGIEARNLHELHTPGPPNTFQGYNSRPAAATTATEAETRSPTQRITRRRIVCPMCKADVIVDMHPHLVAGALAAFEHYGKNEFERQQLFQGRSSLKEYEEMFENIITSAKAKFIRNYRRLKLGPLEHAKPTVDDFIFIRFVAAGGFGAIFLVQEKTKLRFYAAKVYGKRDIVNDSKIRHIFREKDILGSLDFPFTVHMLTSFQSNANLFLIMRFCPGGELLGLIRTKHHLSETAARFYAAQVAMALDYLHANRIIYRDLKPENILLVETGYVKIVDFGMSRFLARNKRAWTLCGTLEFLAPEVILNKGYHHGADWWAFGVFLYELVNGHSPFIDSNRDVAFNRVVDGKFPMPPHFSPALKNLISNLLQTSPTQRYGCLFNGVNDIRCHAWFDGFNWSALCHRNMRPPIRIEVSEDVFRPAKTAADDEAFRRYLQKSETPLYARYFHGF